MAEFKNIKYYEDKLAARLTLPSWRHCMRTKVTAERLAERHGVDKRRAALAGLLHDYVKDYNFSQLTEAAAELGLSVNWVEERNPYLLHAPVGAALVQRDLDINDEEIISAIRKHTIGDLIMSNLDMIIFLADVIEPGRDFAGLESIRRLVSADLRAAYKEAYFKQLEFVLSKRALIHPHSIAVWNHLISEDS